MPGPTLSAICTVKDGAGVPQSTINGVNVTPGNTITVALSSAASVDVWSLSVVSTDELSSSPTISLNQTTKTATFTAPAAGSAVGLLSTVTNVAAGTQATATLGIYTLIGSQRVGFANETIEGSLLFGWESKINPVLRSSTTNTTTFATSLPIAGNNVVLSVPGVQGSVQSFSIAAAMAGGVIVGLTTAASSGGFVSVARIHSTVGNAVTGLGPGAAGRVVVNADATIARIPIPYGGFEIGACDAAGNLTIDPKTPNTSIFRSGLNPVLYGGIPDASGAAHNAATALSNIMALNAMTAVAPLFQGVTAEFHDFFWIAGWTWYVNRPLKVSGLAGGKTQFGRGGLLCDGSAPAIVCCSNTYSVDGGGTQGIVWEDFSCKVLSADINYLPVTQWQPNTSITRGNGRRQKGVQYTNFYGALSNTGFNFRAATSGTTGATRPPDFENVPQFASPTRWSPGQPSIIIGSVVLPTNTSNAWGKYMGMKCTAISGGASKATTGSAEPVWNIGQGNAYICSAQFDGNSALPNNTTAHTYRLVTKTGPNASIGQILKDNGSGSGTMTVITLTVGDSVIAEQAFGGNPVTTVALGLYRWNGSSYVINITTQDVAITWTAYALTDSTNLGLSAFVRPPDNTKPGNPYTDDNGVHWVNESHGGWVVNDASFTSFRCGHQGFQNASLVYGAGGPRPFTSAVFFSINDYMANSCGGCWALAGGDNENDGKIVHCIGEFIGQDPTGRNFDGLGTGIFTKSINPLLVRCFTADSSGPVVWAASGNPAIHECLGENILPTKIDTTATIIGGQDPRQWDKSTQAAVIGVPNRNAAINATDETSQVALYAALDNHDGANLLTFSSGDDLRVAAGQYALMYGPTGGQLAVPVGWWTRNYAFATTPYRLTEGYSGPAAADGPGHRWTMQGEFKGYATRYYEGYEPSGYSGLTAANITGTLRTIGSIFTTNPNAQIGDWRRTAVTGTGSTSSTTRSAAPTAYSAASPWSNKSGDVIAPVDGAGVKLSYECTFAGTSAATANTVQFPGGATIATGKAKHAVGWVPRNVSTTPLTLGEAFRPSPTSSAHLNGAYYLAAARKPCWPLFVANAKMLVGEFVQSTAGNSHGCIFKVTAIAGTGTNGGAEPAVFATANPGDVIISNAGANQVTYTAVEWVRPFATGTFPVGTVFHAVSNTPTIARLLFLCVSQNGTDIPNFTASASVEPTWGAIAAGGTITATGGAVFKAIDPLWSTDAQWLQSHIVLPGDAVTTNPINGHAFTTTHQNYANISTFIGLFFKAVSFPNVNGCIFQLVQGDFGGLLGLTVIGQQITALGAEVAAFATARAGDIVTSANGSKLLAVLLVTGTTAPNLRTEGTNVLWADPNSTYSFDNGIIWATKPILTSTVEPAWRTDGRGTPDDPATTPSPWLEYVFQGAGSLPNTCINVDGTAEWTATNPWPVEGKADYIDDPYIAITPQNVQAITTGPVAYTDTATGYSYQPHHTVIAASNTVHQIAANNDALATLPDGTTKRLRAIPANARGSLDVVVHMIVTNDASSPKAGATIKATVFFTTDPSGNVNLFGAVSTNTINNSAGVTIPNTLVQTFTNTGGGLQVNVNTNDAVNTYSISPIWQITWGV